MKIDQNKQSERKTIRENHKGKNPAWKQFRLIKFLKKINSELTDKPMNSKRAKSRLDSPPHRWAWGREGKREKACGYCPTAHMEWETHTRWEKSRRMSERKETEKRDEKHTRRESEDESLDVLLLLLCDDDAHMIREGRWRRNRRENAKGEMRDKNPTPWAKIPH